MQKPNDSREKRLQRLGAALKDLTPEQREQAIRAAASLLARKAEREQTKKG